MSTSSGASAPPGGIWEHAQARREATLKWLQQAKVVLTTDPSKRIGQLHEQIAQTREYLFRVRDEMLDAKGFLIALQRQQYRAQDAYEDALSSVMFAPRGEEEAKALPKSAEERERYFRQGFLPVYREKLSTERHVEEWEHYEKMLQSVYFSLKDAESAILTQLSILKQQVLSGEVQVTKGAASLFDFMTEGGRELLTRTTPGSPGTPGTLDVSALGAGIEEVQF